MEDRLSPSILDCGGRPLDLSRPSVMGILNVTPDSFSDGGAYPSLQAAIDAAGRMVDEGAALIDVGGESTRPGSAAVPLAEELDRILPVIAALAAALPCPISIDTRKPEVMRAAAEVGAGLINDVCALQEPGALAAAHATGLPVCLMHMQGEPRTMQVAPVYQDVVAEVMAFFEGRIHACEQAGIPRQRLMLDPGFGFGKTLGHNLTLLARLHDFSVLGLPVLAGLSRKSMIGAILGGVPADQRLFGSVAGAMLAVERGAAIVRVHDVKATVDALRVLAAVEGAIGCRETT